MKEHDLLKDLREVVKRNEHNHLRSKPPAIKAFLNELLIDLVQKGKLQPSTSYSYKRCFYSVLSTKETLMDLASFNEAKIIEIRKRCLKRSPSNQVFSRFINILKKINAFAIKKEFSGLKIDFSEFDCVYHREAKAELTYTLEDRNKIIKYALNEKNSLFKRRNASVLALNLELGLRIGELLALKKDDFNKKELLVSVCKTLSRNERGEAKIKKGAKYTSSRVITISKKSLELLKVIEDFNTYIKASSDYLIISKKTKMPYTSADAFIKTAYRSDKSFLSELELDYLISHLSGRKSMATILALKNARSALSELKDISYRLGHKNSATTLDHYIQRILGMDRRILEAFED